MIVDDFAAETRFAPSPDSARPRRGQRAGGPDPRERRASSAASACTAARAQHFSSDDAHFLQAIANVIGAAAERARHEEAVRDSEARFRELADTAPALMWMTDAEGDVTFVNEGWLRFTGRTLDEDLGDTFGLSAHPDDRDELLDALARRLRAARRVPLRVPAALHRKRRVPLGAGGGRARALPGGDFVGYVGTATDIHERKQMEDALRESEASFRDLADSAPVMIWTTDDRGCVTFVNEGWLAYTGTTLEEELGDTWALGVHPDDSPVGRSAAWYETLERRELVGARVPAARPRRRVPLDRRARRPALRGRRFVGYVGTAIDIHERKLMEARLREVYEREHTIAETLQRSLLPERLPHIEGLEIAARYLPAGEGAAIGGDWYDALERPTGAWRSWWATWSATGCAPRRPWASCATPSVPTGWQRARRPR